VDLTPVEWFLAPDGTRLSAQQRWLCRNRTGPTTTLKLGFVVGVAQQVG